MEESALLLTSDVISDPVSYHQLSWDQLGAVFIPRHYRVQIAGVGVISSLVRTVQLLGGDAAVLQVLRVPAGLCFSVSETPTPPPYLPPPKVFRVAQILEA